jgi:hypothetical protein
MAVSPAERQGRPGSIDSTKPGVKTDPGKERVGRMQQSFCRAEDGPVHPDTKIRRGRM